MGMFDVFGWGSTEFSAEYINYIKSKEWKKKRKSKLEQVGYKCLAENRGDCNGPLQVHHLNYNNFGNEKLSDLQVFCAKHHKMADAERKGDLFSDWNMEYSIGQEISEEPQKRWFTDEELDEMLRGTK